MDDWPRIQSMLSRDFKQYGFFNQTAVNYVLTKPLVIFY